jgi:hypothetical protein
MELERAVGATLAKVKQSIKGQHGSYCVYRTSWSPINVGDKRQDLVTRFLRYKRKRLDIRSAFTVAHAWL